MERGKARRETIEIQSVERELLLPGDIGETWEAVADPERLGDWLGGEVEMDPVPGGDFHIRFHDDAGERQGFVEELDEEQRRFAFWWREPDDEISTRVEISLEETADGTLVRVTETSPMSVLDVVGIPLPGYRSQGPTALARAAVLA
jgi:uncharacterized protein YndB with AHSA1/START domain